MFETRARFTMSLVAVVVVLAPLVDAQTTHDVPGDYATIQEAINAAVDGDTVLVAPGTYVESIDFLGKAITVQSASGPDVTIIQASDDSVVRFWSGEGLDSVLDGFTITGGTGTEWSGALLGGGIFCQASSPTIMNNTISGNDLLHSDYHYYDYADQSAAGGGIAALDSSPVIANNLIVGNTLSISGGYEIYCSSKGGDDECHFDHYVTGWGLGGGVFANGGGTLVNNTIQGNVITGEGSPQAVSGGGVWGVDVLLVGNAISGNSATLQSSGLCYDYHSGQSYPCSSANGGGARVLGLSLLLNNTIADNVVVGPGDGSGDAVGGGLSVAGAEATIQNTIVRGNSATDANAQVEAAGAEVSFSNVEGGHPGVGNFDLDPLFVDPANGDYHLQPSSPCIDGGLTDIAQLPLEDADGDQRVLCGVIDVGADEVPEPARGCSPRFVRGDCDGDLVVSPIVDGIFLLAYAFTMGSTPPCLEACDVDGSNDFNGIVDGVYHLAFGFLLGPAPAPPYPLCGGDATPALGCDVTPCP